MTTTRIVRSHAIVLPHPVAAVFPLFTPKGETTWVAGWDPEFLHPADGETCEGMVFRTGHGDEVTLWGCVAWNPAAHHVRYARVTPTSRFGFVDVACRAVDDGCTEVVVGYDYTALSPAGEGVLAALTEAAFVEMIEGWRGETEAVLSRTV